MTHFTFRAAAAVDSGGKLPAHNCCSAACRVARHFGSWGKRFVHKLDIERRFVWRKYFFNLKPLCFHYRGQVTRTAINHLRTARRFIAKPVGFLRAARPLHLLRAEICNHFRIVDGT